MIFIQRDLKNWGSLSRITKTAYIASAAALFYLLLDWAIMPLYTRQYQSVAVPDLLNQSVQCGRTPFARSRTGCGQEH